MVIIIVLNLIFGVIIDTFADLRSEKQKKEEVLKTTCFICGEVMASVQVDTFTRLSSLENYQIPAHDFALDRWCLYGLLKVFPVPVYFFLFCFVLFF